MVCNSMLFLLQNFHTTTLPQSKNGRLIREKYQPTPPPSYKSVEHALNGKYTFHLVYDRKGKI